MADADLLSAGGREIHLKRAKSFFLPKLRKVSQFLVNQGFTTAGNLLYGLLCVRLLPISDYAKFAVIFGIQGTLTMLMDVGVSGTLVPLVGDRIYDRQLIADYLASLRQIVHRLYGLVAVVTIAVFPWFVRNRHWGWRTVAAMIVIVLASSWFVRVTGSYGTILILLRDRTSWYRAQMVSSFGTLGLLLLVWAFHYLNAFTAILINVAGVLSVAVTYFYRARHLLGTEGTPTPEKRKAVLQLSLPVAPGAIFYAMQGQISLLLITIFGRTAAVASVGALGRMAQVFSLLGQMNILLVEPHFAKLPVNRLKTHYLIAVAAAALGGIAFISLAAVFPQLFLWILGPKYAGLHVELLLVIINGALGLVSGGMYMINNSRRFVYWWQNATIILCTLAVQAMFLWKSDLQTVRSVLYFAIVSTSVIFVVQVISAFYGFARGPRRIAGIDQHIEPA